MSEVNVYTPRKLIGAINQLQVPKRFLLDTFFKAQIDFDTEKVDVDLKKGNRNIAMFVNPLENGHLVENGGYETKTVSPGYTKEFKAIRPKDNVKRAFGETYDQPLSPREREARLIGEGLVDLESRIVRLEEVMAAQALINGEVIVRGKKIDHKVSFGYEAGKQKIILSGESCWDHKNSDPMYDLDDWSEGISERSGLAPDIIVCGKRSVRAIIDHPKVQERLDIRNYHMGQIDMETEKALREQGIVYHGMLAPSNIPIYSYSEKYFDEVTQSVIPVVPEDAVLMGSTLAGCQMLYGLIQNTFSLQATPRFPWSWVEQDGSARYIQLESAPLPNLHQVDAFVSARVLSK